MQDVIFWKMMHPSLNEKAWFQDNFIVLLAWYFFYPLRFLSVTSQECKCFLKTSVVLFSSLTDFVHYVLNQISLISSGHALQLSSFYSRPGAMHTRQAETSQDICSQMCVPSTVGNVSTAQLMDEGPAWLLYIWLCSCVLNCLECIAYWLFWWI